MVHNTKQAIEGSSEHKDQFVAKYELRTDPGHGQQVESPICLLGRSGSASASRERFPTGNPIDGAIARCNSWHKNLRQFVVYLREAVAYLETKAHHHKLSVETLSTAFKDPSENVQRLQLRDNENPVLQSNVNVLLDAAETFGTLHKATADEAIKHSKLIAATIPQIEELRKNVVSSISTFENMRPLFRHIRDLESDEEKCDDAVTKYAEAIHTALLGHSPDVDPYLLKVGVEKRIKRRLATERKAFDAYASCEDYLVSLEAGIMSKLHEALQICGQYIDKSSKLEAQTAHEILTNVVKRDPLSEVKDFIAQNSDYFIGKTLGVRTVERYLYPYCDSNFAREVRRGELSCRARFLKSLKWSVYVLTLQTLIEMRDGRPHSGLNLSDAELYLNKHPKTRFTLRACRIGSKSGSKHTWVFTAGSEEEASCWINDLKKIIDSKTPEDKMNAVFEQPSEQRRMQVPDLVLNSEAGDVEPRTSLDSVDYYNSEYSDVSEIPPDTFQDYVSSAEGSDNEGEAEEQRRWPSYTNLGDQLTPQMYDNAGDMRPHCKYLLRTKIEHNHEDAHGSAVLDELSAEDDDSVFSYDLNHPASTYDGKDYEPPNAELPPAIERRLTTTSHKSEDPDVGIGHARTAADVDAEQGQHRSRRTSSVHSVMSSQTRRATASFGESDRPSLPKPLTPAK